MDNREKRELKKIIDSLSVDVTRNNLNLHFLLEALAPKLTRRQAIILRLILLDNNITQSEIAKMLGYSAPTVSIEMGKIRKIVVKIKKLEGKNYSKYIKKRIKNN